MIISYLKIDVALITKAAHVCHHWRAIILSCPILWTHPNFARKSQTLSFLRLSEPFPIHVDLTSTYLTQSLLKLLCLHSGRVDTLRIVRPAILHKLLDQPLAALRNLEIAAPCIGLFQPLDVYSRARELPALTSLTIRNNPDALSFRGPRITQLHVTIPRLSALEVAALFNLVRSCVLLEELEIENKHGLEDGLLLLPDNIIPVPHLRSFTQTLHRYQHSAGVLNNLSPPPHCLVALRCISDSIHNGYPPLSLPDLRNGSYFTNVKRLKISHAERYPGCEASITLDFINDSGARLTARTEFVRYTIVTSRERVGSEKINLSASLVEVLCVGGPRWVRMKNCHRLTTLILSGAVIHRYLKLLAGTDGPDTCKSLHTLVLFVEPNLLTSDLVPRLLKAAQTRAKAGLPLRTITFACPSVLAPKHLAILGGLREYVERIDVLLGDDTLDWNLDKYFLHGI